MSSKGQVVIPIELRKLLGISEGDEFYVFGRDDTLVLKKIEKAALEREFDEIVKPIREKAKRLGLTRADLEGEIRAYRRDKGKGHESCV
ncbi:MAG: AbrB/MazE/SpoVT family DNA-binding domain-containing protein [Candidatus Dadabacteria bacterium]|nr:AbrB/MazE/SpoVT family DNA-binding domain-containing protein [Candidatus Dadabacteria bacterium]